MGRFPQRFIDDLKAQADIVQVVQDHVSLKKAGAGFKGLCPFHGERTPSFHVNREKGFFHCFGCGVGGDVFKFLELQLKLRFQEAVEHLSRRFGLTPPPVSEGGGDAAAAAEREALLKLHELATDYFREQMASTSGLEARRQLEGRGLTTATTDLLKLGMAPPTRDGLGTVLGRQGFAPEVLLRSGLVVEREGRLVDRFRNRLMIPICRESGSVVAFGGRAMGAAQQPKYLNSPETAIYTKGRTLYGLNLSKAAIRRVGYAVLVEGYFDFAQALQAGVGSVVATCGTALTQPQGRLLKRFTGKVVLSFDPDAAGRTAASRSGELLTTEGFQVNVAVLPAGSDPDTFVREHGTAKYLVKLRKSRPYLEYVLDAVAAEHDFGNPESRRRFLARMLPVAARIPDAATRDQFADRLAHRARVMDEVVRAEIRRAAVARRTDLDVRELPVLGRITPAEQGLIWGLAHDPEAALDALAELEAPDLELLSTGPILEAARSLVGHPPAAVPDTVRERLNETEATLLARIAAESGPAATPAECGRALRRLRYERERAAVQREIDRLQEAGGESDLARIDALWQQKMDLLHRIEGLSS